MLTEIELESLGLAGASDEDGAMPRELVARLSEDERSGAVFCVPPVVDVTEARDVLLTLALSGWSPLTVQSNEDGVLVVTNLDTRVSYVGRWRPWRTPSREVEPPPPPDEEDVDNPEGLDLTPAKAFTVVTSEASLRTQVASLPWRPSSLHVQLLMDGWESRRHPLTLSDGELLSDATMSDFLAPQRLVEEDPSVTYDEGAGMWLGAAQVPRSLSVLEVPTLPGLQAAVVPVAFSSHTEPVVLVFAMHVALLPHEHVALGEGQVDPGYRAVVPLTIVLTSDALSEPALLRVRVPIDAVDDLADTLSLGRAHYALDLNALARMPRVPGRYQVRAIAGEHQSETLPLTLVPENLRPVRPAPAS